MEVVFLCHRHDECTLSNGERGAGVNTPVCMTGNNRLHGHHGQQLQQGPHGYHGSHGFHGQHGHHDPKITQVGMDCANRTASMDSMDRKNLQHGSHGHHGSHGLHG